MTAKTGEGTEGTEGAERGRRGRRRVNLRKIETMLGFAIKSNNIVMGTDSIESTKKPVYLIIADESISERTRAILNRIAEKRKTQLLIITEKLEDIVHKTNCKVVAVTDRSMSENIIKNAGIGGGNLID